MAVSDYSPTPALNSSVGGIGIAEGAPAKNMNNAMRQILADLATFYAGLSLKDKATLAEATAGVIDTKGVTPYTASAIAAAKVAPLASALATGTVSALVETRTYATQAALYADLVPADGKFALVYNDSTASKNDLYVKSGATGTGSWSAPLGIFAKAAQAVVQPQVDAAQGYATAASTAVAGLTSQLSSTIDQIAGRSAGATPLDGTSLSNNTYICNTPATAASVLSKVEFFAKAAGTIKFKVYNSAGGYVSTSSVVTVAGTGVTVLTAADFGVVNVPAGGFVGFYAPASGGATPTFTGNAQDGAGWGSQGGDVTTTWTPNNIGAGNRVEMRLTFSHQEVAATPSVIQSLQASAAQVAANSAQLAREFVAGTQHIGRPLGLDPVDGGFGLGNGNTYPFFAAALRDGVLTQIDLWVRAVGSLYVRKFIRTAPDTYQATFSKEVAIGSTGAKSLTAADFGTIPVAAGEYLGISTSSAFAFAFTNGAANDAGGWAQVAGGTVGPNTTTPFTPAYGSTNQRPDIRFTISEPDQLSTAAYIASTRLAASEARKAKYPIATADQITLLTNGGWNHGLGYGQSNSVGANAGTVLTTAATYANVTFGSGPASSKPGNTWGAANTSPGTSTTIPLREFDLNPSADGTHCYETHVSGEANWLTGLLIANDGLTPATAVMFGSTAGWGSSRLDQLNKASSRYPQLRSHVTEAKARATAAGVSYVIQTVSWIQGEHDALAGTSRATHLVGLKQLADDIDTDLRADAGGQSSKVHMLIMQTGSPTSSGSTANYDNIVLAQLDAARQHSRIHLVAPMYRFYQFSLDGLHLYAHHQKLMGRYLGRARYQLIVEKREPDRIRILSATAQGRVVTVRFDVPAGPLVFDAGIVGLATNYGFQVIDDSGVLTGLSTPIINADGLSVSMTADRDLGANPRVRYALDYIGIGTRNTNGAVGNLRDSTPDRCTIAGVPFGMHHWCPNFEQAVQVLEA